MILGDTEREKPQVGKDLAVNRSPMSLDDY